MKEGKVTWERNTQNSYNPTLKKKKKKAGH